MRSRRTNIEVPHGCLEGRVHQSESIRLATLTISFPKLFVRGSFPRARGDGGEGSPSCSRPSITGLCGVWGFTASLCRGAQTIAPRAVSRRSNPPYPCEGAGPHWPAPFFCCGISHRSIMAWRLRSSGQLKKLVSFLLPQAEPWCLLDIRASWLDRCCPARHGRAAHGHRYPNVAIEIAARLSNAAKPLGRADRRAEAGTSTNVTKVSDPGV